MAIVGPPRQHPGSAPSHWGRAKLADVALLIRQGKACGRHSRRPPGLLHLRPMNVTRDGGVDISDSRFIDEAYAGEFPRVARGDVLFNNTNSRELVGKTTSIEADDRWAFSNHMTLLRFPRAISQRFMAHQLHFFWMSGVFEPLLKQYVNQATVSIRALRDLEVALPPTGEQSEIAEKVDALLAHVRKASVLLERGGTNIKRYTRAVLRRAADGTISPLDGERNSDRVLIDEAARNVGPRNPGEAQAAGRRIGQAANLRDSSVQDMHLGWSFVRVDDVGETRLGMQRRPDRHTGDNLRPYLRVANVLDNSIDFADLKYMNFQPSEYRRYRLRSGDILLNEGQSLALVGRPAMYCGEIQDVCFQNTLIRFRAGDEVEPEFALIVFRHYFYSGRFSEIARWSTNIAHLGLKRFSGLPFPLPSIEEQRRICAVARVLLDGVARQAEAIPKLFRRLDSLRYAILRDGLAGKLTDGDQSGDPEKLVAELVGAVAKGKIHNPEGGDAMGKGRSDYRRKRREVRELGLTEILKQEGGRLSAYDLLDRSGFDEDSIDEFYSVLAQEVREGRMKEERQPEGASSVSFEPRSMVELVD